ncbi:MAG: hypothetical protein A3F46_04820 [Legionellales bacterium RIFCSPHIGHO2_12_FULL_42_9]|nr:MAG: hypothetical protein A3F46_04820 [Legionellales bacterium RIFCSPHIGHO2_12_FULL_42_9]
MLPNDYKEEWYLKLKLLYETPYVISHLTDEPNGQLDVQAFIDKKDHCWEVLDTTKKNEKKTLILTSWCFQHLNHFRGLINFLVDLIEDNFAIYMPQEDTLVNIKESFFSELAAFTPITTQKARLMAARVSLSNDKIDIINLQRLRELARQIKETTPYGVYKLPREGDIYDANRPLNLSSDQIRVIEEAIDPDDEIHYVFQKDTAPFLHPVKQHIKTLKINDNLSTEEVDFIALVAPSLETLIFSSCGVFSTNLPCLKTLVLSGSTLSSAQLSTLLKMTPNLENLTINYCPNLTGQSLTLDSEQLRNLKTLSTFSALNSVQLASLLEVTCQLEELYIMDNDHGEPGNCFFSTHQLTPQLKNLKVLTMSQSTLSLLTLANILQSTPQLEKIQLYRALKMGSDHLQLPSLNRLKTVSLTCDSLTSYQLSEMIASAPYVENLTISCLNSHGTPLNLRRTQLSHLKELRIDSTPCLYSEQFFTIIANASNLEKLEISFHDSIGESIPSVKLGQLEHLKSVEIGNQPFTLKQFHILLNAAHYIESLTIHFSKFKYLLELQPGQLPRLQYFNISWSEVTPNELSALLAAAPHLVLLELFDCANLGVGKRSLCLRANHITQLRNIALDKMAKKIRQLSQESEVSGFYFNGKDREQIPPDQNTHLIDGQLSTDEPRTFESKQLFKGHAGHAPDTRIYHLQSLRFVRPFLYREYVPTLETLEKTNAVIFPSAQKIRDSFENTDNYNTKYHFYGQTTLTGLKPHTWNQLPALSVSDRLLGYFSNLHSEYEIRWDNTSGYYYIKVSKPSSGIISYVIESKPEFTIAQDSSPESLMTLMKSLQFQSDGTLIKNKAYTYLKTRPCDELIYALTQFCTFPNSAIKKITGSPMDIFNQLIKIRTGACRHRAKLFVALASELGLTASLIQNKAHSFVTVLDETRVCRAIDLGGIPVRIVEMEMPDLPEEIIVTPDNPFQTWNTQPLKARDMTSLAVELKCQSFQRHLVILDNEEAIEALHTAVVDKSMRCFFKRGSPPPQRREGLVY